MIASGIFDHPLVVFAVLIAGAIIQWLTQKRQAEEARRQSEAEQAGIPEPPREEAALERKLRELLGQEPESQPAREYGESASQSQPPDRVYREPPPPVVSLPEPPQIVIQSRGFQVPALPKEMGRTLGVMKARLPSEMPGLRSTRRRGSSTQTWLWRDRKSARRAFVASLVFGPPKGLEP